ncbi:ankyrin repeat domain-containing protein [Lutibacter flavus]|uniref:Ankyrin repeat-containing protein n=1 Tax=Lutibacter flavus TaxID=691689 RepID=A0A238ZIV2_9FLAO|nr:ankyrin repeat domain-containing protein [Lutibacter flavus]SNR83069.1 Ankyrin repeat-containing protein [Lutibacter flavus]
MRNYIYFFIFLLLSSTVNANNDNDTLNIISNTQPTKKVKSSSKKTIKNNSFIHFSNPYKLNTFCRLIQAGNYDAVKKCIKKGFDINEESIRLTPLMYAARHNRIEIVKLLIDNGANLKIKDNKGHTALKWAKLSNATESYNIIFNALKKNKH